MVQYQDLVNKDGTIYNTQTGKGYSTPEQLAADLGIPAGSIQWGSITNRPDYVPGMNFNYGGQQQAPPPQQQQQGLTGVPQLDEVYSQLEKYVTDLQANGQRVNPNIEISPATAQQFLDKAQGEINPYYASQIDSMKNELKSSLDVMQKQYDLGKRNQESQFQLDLKNKRETLADQGAAQSGFRGQQEQQLQQNAQRTMEGLGLGAAGAASSALYGGAQTLGSKNISDLTGYGNVNTSTSSLPGKNLNFYNPTPITGSTEYAQNADVRNLQDFFTQQEVKKRSLSFT